MKHKVLIIGGGTAGITVAAQLKLKDHQLDVAIIEPSDKHYYQPAWTLVGADTFKYEDTIRNEADYIPKGVKWIKEFAEEIDADKSFVKLRNGEVVEYEYLVVAVGVQYDWTGIEGLAETIDKNGVCSNYSNPLYTREVLKGFKGGNALFTQPATQIKCGGAPQKIMYLAEEFFQKSGVRNKTKIIFATPGSVIFGVKEFAIELERIIEKKKIEVRFHRTLKKIDGPNKKAYYEVVRYDQTGCVVLQPSGDPEKYEEVIDFEMLHLAPPQSAPDFVKRSKLAYTEGVNKGWVKVDINSLQCVEYPNVFALGDVAALPTAKTGAAVRKQAPVVVDNLLKLMQGKTADNKDYTGYSSCPLVTGYGKMLLAEFGYNNKRMSDPLISKFVDTTKEKWSMWILKKYVLPMMYWKLMLRGKA